MGSFREGAGAPPGDAGHRPSSLRPLPRAAAAVVAAGLLILLGTIGEVALGNIREGHVARRLTLFQGLFLAQFAAFLLALTGVMALSRRRGGPNRGLLAYILVIALAARLVLLLFSQLNLSRTYESLIARGFQVEICGIDFGGDA